MIIVSQDSRVSSALTSLMVIITASSILIQPPNSTVQAFVKTTEQPINRVRLTDKYNLATRVQDVTSKQFEPTSHSTSTSATAFDSSGTIDSDAAGSLGAWDSAPPEYRQPVNDELDRLGSRQNQASSSSFSLVRRTKNLNSWQDDKTKNLDDYLEGLPILSVAQKHTAQFDCELNNKLGTPMPVWVKLRKDDDHQTNQSNGQDSSVQKSKGYDTVLLSLGQKMITRDRRFKVTRQLNTRWTLQIENVGPSDDQAFYLCQSGSVDKMSGQKSQGPNELGPENSFAGGAMLNVLVPPKIVEQDTSESQLQANEYDSLKLRCKFISEPQSQIIWRREDGKSIDGVEQRFSHKIERRNHGRITSIDSTELIFRPLLRSHASSYLCIASNGVQSGVSQRMAVVVVNCRSSPDPKSSGESCELQSSSVNDIEPSDTNIEPTTTTTTPSTAKPSSPARTLWKSNPSRPSPNIDNKKRRIYQPSSVSSGDKKRLNVSIKSNSDSIRTVSSSGCKSYLQLWPESVSFGLCVLVGLVLTHSLRL